MKGTLNKTEQGWVIRYGDMLFLPLHPYQDELKMVMILNTPVSEFEGKEVEFDWCVIVDHDSGKGKEYAKLLDKKVICEYSGLPSVTSYTTSEYPELEGTMALCNDKVWDDIYEEYSTEQYPAFGGPFTDSISFIDWLKLYYKFPEKK
jgi:hypothetical protein